MPNKTNETSSKNTTVAELFHLQLNTSDLKAFFSKSKSIHDFFSEIEGYSGMEILLISETNIMILFRWENAKKFEKNLGQILHACPIADWLKNAVSIAHQPAISKEFKKSKL